MATGAAGVTGAAAAEAARRRRRLRSGGGGGAAAAGAARRRRGRRGGGGGGAAAAGAARRRSARARREDVTTTVAGPRTRRLALSKDACHDPEPRERAQTRRNLPIGPVAEHWWSIPHISICCDIGVQPTIVLSSPDSTDGPTNSRGWLGGDGPQSAVGTSAEWSGGPKIFRGPNPGPGRKTQPAPIPNAARKALLGGYFRPPIGGRHGTFRVVMWRRAGSGFWPGNAAF